MATKSRHQPKGGPRLSIIPARAVTDPNITAQALRVLALLGRHTDDEGWCRRSQVTMAAELNCGRGTIQRGLDLLVLHGYVQKQLEGRGKIKANPDKQPFAAYSFRVSLDPVDRSNEGAHGRAPGAQPGGHRVPTPWAPLTERLLVNDPLITEARAPAPVDTPARAPVLWEAIRHGMGNLRFSQHCRGGMAVLKDGTLVVSFDTEAKAVRAQDVVEEMARAAGVPVRISLRAA